MPFSPAHQVIHIQRTHKPRVTLAEISNTHKRHSSRQLRSQDVNEVLNTFTSIIDSVQERPTHPNSCGTQTHAFEDIGASAHAAVDEDFEVGEDGGAVELAFEEGHDRWWRAGGEKVSG
jgi:hypothetical protein